MTGTEAPPTQSRHPAALLQALLRFDTSNPPGSEAECIGYLRALLEAAGVECRIVARAPGRPNLVARLAGTGVSPPLLLYGHVDVVPTAGQHWTQPPFGGVELDGCLYGRGALDMKGGVAMLLAAFLRARAERLRLPGDVLLLILSDEEAGGDYGARFLVERHPELFEGVNRAIGEFGGFSLHIGGRKFYPVQVAEKQICHLRAVVRGEGGHGSLPARGGAMARLGHLLTNLDTKRLPVHVTPVARQFIETIASAIPGPKGTLLRMLLRPGWTDRVLGAVGEHACFFEPILRNTLNVTMLRCGECVNVIPSEVSLELDGRLLPGVSPQAFLSEIRMIVGERAEFEVLRHDPGPPQAEMGLFGLLSELLRHADPEGIPVPLLLPGATDARFFARLGIQTYGFLPMDLPPDFKFSAMIHGPDERVPVRALEFGAEVLYRLLERFGEPRWQ